MRGRQAEKEIIQNRLAAVKNAVPSMFFHIIGFTQKKQKMSLPHRGCHLPAELLNSFFWDRNVF